MEQTVITYDVLKSKLQKEKYSIYQIRKTKVLCAIEKTIFFFTIFQGRTPLSWAIRYGTVMWLNITKTV